MENHSLFKKQQNPTQQIVPPPFFAIFFHFLVLVQGTILYLLANLPKQKKNTRVRTETG